METSLLLKKNGGNQILSRINILYLALSVLLFSSCVFQGKSFSLEKGITICTWNVQTFFDSNIDGTEYSDFTGPKSKWCIDAYITRLERIAEIIQDINSDIMVFQEIENEKVIYDIQNYLTYNQSYKYSAFYKNKESPFGCAVLSKFPVENMRVHKFEYCSDSAKMPDLRPIVEVEFNIKNEKLHLFACHFKSRKKDDKETGFWRNYQLSLLADVMNEAKNDGYVIAAGDFNKDINDFEHDDEYVLLKGFCSDIRLKSPWLEYSKNCPEGSYYYKKNWSKIDHIFVASDDICLNNFDAYKGKNVSKNGIPQKYQVFSGRGYSDHLPLTATLQKL